MRTTYSDPTANAAIANIIREEREKKRREQMKKKQDSDSGRKQPTPTNRPKARENASRSCWPGGVFTDSAQGEKGRNERTGGRIDDDGAVLRAERG